MLNESSADAFFTRSTFCAEENCVEVSIDKVYGIVRVRNTSERMTIEFAVDDWAALVRGVKAGEFDI